MEHTVDFLVQEILKAIPNRENYSKVSLSELMTDAGIDFLLNDYMLRFDIRDLVVKEAKKAGYILDYSEFDGCFGGAPFNEPAVIIKPGAVTEAHFLWYAGGMRLDEDIAFVQTKILQQEIQIRPYNGRKELLKDFIFPVRPDFRNKLFSLLEKCDSAWKQDDYSVDVCDGGSWEVRLLSGRKVLRKVCGTVMRPPLGDQLENIVCEIVGSNNLYLFNKKDDGMSCNQGVEMMDSSGNEKAEYERAIFDIQRIKNGEVAELSVAQITYLNTNMSDAQQNLPEDKFYQVYCLFLELLTNKEKIKMDIDGYLETAMKIIKRFDEIAPYEKYCGQDEAEMAALMHEIRNEREENDTDIPPAGEILVRRITAVCQKDKYIYRDLIINNIDEIRVILNNGKVYDEDKAAGYIGKLRNIYYDQVSKDFLEYLKQVHIEIYNRALYAMNNPSICGLTDRKPDDVWMAGDLYAICHWAVTNTAWNEDEYIQITDMQNGLMEEAFQEALQMLNDKGVL